MAGGFHLVLIGHLPQDESGFSGNQGDDVIAKNSYKFTGGTTPRVASGKRSYNIGSEHN
jgi:hypothetical protein